MTDTGSPGTPDGGTPDGGTPDGGNTDPGSGLPPNPINALPGYEYVGRAFDALKIDPIDIKQGACDQQALDITEFDNLPAVPTIYAGPSFVSKPKICDYLPKAGGTFEQVICDNSSAFDLSSSLKTDVNFSAGDPAGLYSGSLSLSYSRAEGQKGSAQRVTTFTSEVVSLFQLTINDLDTVVATPRLRAALAALPTKPDGEFSDFIARFGTHYASKVVLGGRMTQVITVSRQDYESFLQTGVNVRADASATFEAVSVKGGVGVDQQASSTFRKASSLSVEKVTFSGGDPQTSPDMWSTSVKMLVAPLQVALQPLSSLLTAAAFPDDPDVSQRRAALEQATHEYLAAHGRDPNADAIALGDEVRFVLVGPGHPLALTVATGFVGADPYDPDSATPNPAQSWVIGAADGRVDSATALAARKLVVAPAGQASQLDASTGHDATYAKGDGLVGLSSGHAGDNATWLVETVSAAPRPGNQVVDGDYVHIRTPWSGTGIGAGYLIGPASGAGAGTGVFAFGKKDQQGSIWSIQRVKKGG